MDSLENVPDAISRKTCLTSRIIWMSLISLNYNTYYKVLNAHELGSAQKENVYSQYL